MAYIDATYYKDSFHCTTMPEQFDRLADIASDIIDGIVSKPVQSLDKTSDAYQLVQKACAYIVETLDANGGVDATTDCLTLVFLACPLAITVRAGTTHRKRARLVLSGLAIFVFLVWRFRFCDAPG